MTVEYLSVEQVLALHEQQLRLAQVELTVEGSTAAQIADLVAAIDGAGYAGCTSAKSCLRCSISGSTRA